LWKLRKIRWQWLLDSSLVGNNSGM